MWKKEKKDAKVILGENSLDLPYQFFDLKIPELSLELLDTGLQKKRKMQRSAIRNLRMNIIFGLISAVFLRKRGDTTEITI